MNLIWFRNDLRVAANPALSAVMEQGKTAVAIVFLVPESWNEQSDSPAKLGLWRDRLRILETELADLGIALKVINAGHFDQVPKLLLNFVQELNIEGVYFNAEYPLNEQVRDRKALGLLDKHQIKAVKFHGDLIVPPGELKTGQGGDFKVYTPFARAWRRNLSAYDRPILAVKTKLPDSGLVSDEIPEDLCWQVLEYDTDLWPADSQSIRERVYQFMDLSEKSYFQRRDFPAVDGTSRLSPYLSIGAVSPLQLMHVQRAQYSDDSWLESSWLNEIIWREFYRHLICAFPGLSKLEPFRPESEARIVWQKNDNAFEAWCAGETGFPIIDAAMKQLLETGWMHNRLRMLVASFLTKLLGIDWRLGESFFMSKLIDGDFASNMGGWQWSASVGADAAPYFRIFNPMTQSEKFDPEGEFLVRWLPELSKLSPKQRHQPGAGQEFGRPSPIIDYKIARQFSLDQYKSRG